MVCLLSGENGMGGLIDCRTCMNFQCLCLGFAIGFLGFWSYIVDSERGKDILFRVETESQSHLGVDFYFEDHCDAMLVPPPM